MVEFNIVLINKEQIKENTLLIIWMLDLLQFSYNKGSKILDKAGH